MMVIFLYESSHAVFSRYQRCDAYYDMSTYMPYYCHVFMFLIKPLGGESEQESQLGERKTLGS